MVNENLKHIAVFRGDEFLARLPEVLHRVAEQYDRVILDHDGRRVAIVSIEDLEYLEHADRVMDAQDLAELEKQTPEDRQTISWEQYLRESSEQAAAESNEQS